MEPQIVRTSDRSTFKRCRVLWDWTSKIRQNYEPLRRIAAFDFGTAIHAGLEAYYDPETWWDDRAKKESYACVAFRESIRRVQLKVAEAGVEVDDGFAEERELGLGMLDHYFRWAPEHDDSLRPVLVEQEFEVPLYAGSVYQGRVDLVVEDRFGYWIVDHKTTATFGGTEWLALDDQCSSYAWALERQLGLRVRGVIYNELRKKLPHRPKLLNRGVLSLDKSQETTHDIYLQTILDEGFDPKPYTDFLAYLKEYPKEFFRRTRVTFTPRHSRHRGEAHHGRGHGNAGRSEHLPDPVQVQLHWLPVPGAVYSTA